MSVFKKAVNKLDDLKIKALEKEVEGLANRLVKKYGGKTVIEYFVDHSVIHVINPKAFGAGGLFVYVRSKKTHLSKYFFEVYYTPEQRARVEKKLDRPQPKVKGGDHLHNSEKSLFKAIDKALNDPSLREGAGE